MNIPQALADLLNKTDAGWIVFAHMVPTRIFRLTAHESFKTFRVEQFTRSNKDNFNPQGAWHTLSTHGSETPGAMLQAACSAAIKSQNDFLAKMQKKVEARDDEIRKKLQG